MKTRSRSPCGKRAALIRIAIAFAGSCFFLAGTSSALLHESGIPRQIPDPSRHHTIPDHGIHPSDTGTTRVHMAGHHDGVSASPTVRTTQRHSHTGLAHGILCPETVTKMDELTQGGRNNRAVKAFLDRYKRYGPMSCMELLSDPEILPHLTTTLRGLV
mmetsp:Transcript_21007/g.49578  ORF Transcript_21007/g.49578 Transcript_21007/m.49578 type:complete len:159 (+) Transcript_21007:570-1046(+)